MIWSVLGSAIWAGLKGIGSIFVGGNLESILRTIDKGMSDEVRREEIKAEVTKKWIDAQASLLVGRTWWFQLFFVIPAGVYWTGMIGAQFPFTGWVVHRMPGFAEEVFLAIISALFIVDGGKALLSRWKQ